MKKYGVNSTATRTADLATLAENTQQEWEEFQEENEAKLEKELQDYLDTLPPQLEKFTKQSQESYNQIAEMFPEIVDINLLGPWDELTAHATDYVAPYRLFRHPVPIDSVTFSEAKKQKIDLTQQDGSYYYSAAHESGSGGYTVVFKDKVTLGSKEKTKLGEYLSSLGRSMDEIKYIIVYSRSRRTGDYGTYTSQQQTIYYNEQ